MRLGQCHYLSLIQIKGHLKVTFYRTQGYFGIPLFRVTSLTTDFNFRTPQMSKIRICAKLIKIPNCAQSLLLADWTASLFNNFPSSELAAELNLKHLTNTDFCTKNQLPMNHEARTRMWLP